MISAESQGLHSDSVVVDLHNDLIVMVDFFDLRSKGDIFSDFWLPELRRGGVKVQVLAICIDEASHQSEGSLRRTLLLTQRIHDLAAAHSDDVALCLTASDIDAAVGSGKVALIIALEGAHGLGQDAALIRTVEKLGVRMVSLAHWGRTFLADGSGVDDTSAGGLTPQGIEVFKEMERLGIVFDVSHLGVRGVDDVLELATRPFFASHSACRAIIDIHRNLTDSQIKGIASAGGVIGVAAAIPHFIDPTNPSAARVVDHIEHLVGLVGMDHVAIGADFIDDYYKEIHGGWPVIPGAPTEVAAAEIKRPSDLPRLTEGMLSRGFSSDDIQKVLGLNAMRVFRQVMGIPVSD